MWAGHPPAALCLPAVLPARIATRSVAGGRTALQAGASLRAGVLYPAGIRTSQWIVDAPAADSQGERLPMWEAFSERRIVFPSPRRSETASHVESPNTALDGIRNVP